jgi:hypothetical protein
MEAIPQNQQTVELVKNVLTQITGNKESPEASILKELHQLPNNRTNGISAANLELAQRNINQTIQAALSLELAKKHVKTCNF